MTDGKTLLLDGCEERRPRSGPRDLEPDNPPSSTTKNRPPLGERAL
ncbi:MULTISPECIES: hypothetical protein [unclassified Streptomyces]|uniref:Uncharacterized protein n=1 Tax=Streptomyces sp. R35 TaxID=3238630 RepID=A0AB39SQR5_9ACTN|nr:hypothetical protein OG324_48780 [Streptomyces sp. NBC_01236]